MTEHYPNDKPKPKLELEYSGGGPNSKARTAIGAGESNNSPKLTSKLATEPFWFQFIKQRQIAKYRQSFSKMSLEDGLILLRDMNLPTVTMLALGLKWGFIDPDVDGFTYVELDELFFEKHLLVDSRFKPPAIANISKRLKFRYEELSRLETRAAYWIWNYERLTKQS